MRWISIAALVSASLFPVASGSPCRPHSTTTSAISTTAVSVESSSTATVENPTTVTTTTAADVTTKATEATTTTNAESTTAEELTSTTKAETTSTVEASTTADAETSSTAEATTTTTAEISTAEATTTTTSETTTAEATTTTTAETTTAEATSTTTTGAAGPTNAVQNAGFEDVPNTAWVLQGTTIMNTGLAHTGTHFLEIDVNNNFAIGQNIATQVVNGLDTTLSYQLALYYTVFSNPTPVIIPGTICFVQVNQGDSIILQSPVNFASLDSYQQYSISFTPASTSISLSLRLRCTNGRRVTLALGIDDVSISTT
ncbi:hypothetical protein FPCIR_11249 [Fusarium pseudocircinatum]|uniref:CBM-cenC domain-containing protein n=1 Tax=Fusarium pseudocircinatum TaxID=56676 RepID=A0A8H5KTW0_9HYPO|nr:hypothetical protein FPCIR_11249 [Fusarium pseudocircinatum]